MSKLRGFDPFVSDIDCLDPQIIINPKVPELIALHGNYVLKGDFVEARYSSLQVNLFPWKRFSPDRLGITLSDLPNCFVVDMTNGEIFPFYFVVPCGKCIICSSSKCSNFARRCQYESQCYDCDPVHITITYDAAHLPADRSVNLRHIQLWKKRFRITLERMMYTRQLRICVAAEYGTRNTRRPHYHCIIWNLKPDSVFTYEQLREIAWLCWYDEFDPLQEPMCDMLRFQLMPINDQYVPKGSNRTLAQMGKSSYQAFGYVAKYFYKQDNSVVPEGCRPLFHTMSKTKGLGGIGAPFLDKHKLYLQSHLRKVYNYLEKHGTMEQIVYDRYVLNRIFPSKYLSVPYRARKALRCLFRYASLYPDLESRVSRVFHTFGRLYPILPISDPDPGFCFKGRSRCLLIQHFNSLLVRDSLSYLESISPGLDIDYILHVDNLRKQLLSLLFRDKQPINVHSLSLKLLRYKSRRSHQFVQL